MRQFKEHHAQRRAAGKSNAFGAGRHGEIIAQPGEKRSIDRQGLFALGGDAVRKVGAGPEKSAKCALPQRIDDDLVGLQRKGCHRLQHRIGGPVERQVEAVNAPAEKAGYAPMNDHGPSGRLGHGQHISKPGGFQGDSPRLQKLNLLFRALEQCGPRYQRR
ncbi:hypothetical protein ACQY1H_12985 [Agrobacterium vitis]|uniref:hypothetical protein n=1 Tax=Agrobacterium vitis TaxID=373 RepID=UPI003D2D2E84